MQIGNHKLYKYSLQIIDSNMYLFMSNAHALIIDPQESDDALVMLGGSGCKDLTVILTHEHFDHVSGVNSLRHFASQHRIPCSVYAQEVCAEAITDPDKNLSRNADVLFILKSPEEQAMARTLFSPDYACYADHTFESTQSLDWEDLILVLRSTPGHTPGSICIEIYDQEKKLLALATGDSLILNQKVITRLPSGSKKSYKEITLPYLENIPSDTLILPGHGEVSLMKNFELG